MTSKLSIITIIIVLGFVFALLQWSVHHPVSQEYDGRQVVVNPGTSSEEIGAMLKEKGIIESRYAFDFYVWRSGLDDSLQAGEYVLSPSMTISEIATVLSGGRAVSSDIIITIPEGFTVRQIAERLAANDVIASADVFLETVLDVTEFPFLNPREGHLQVRELEGYLFPETYRFEPRSAPETVAIRLLGEFDERIARPFALELGEQEYSFEEILTMASLIEDEVRSEEDRAIVSGKRYPSSSRT